MNDDDDYCDFVTLILWLTNAWFVGLNYMLNWIVPSFFVFFRFIDMHSVVVCIGFDVLQI